MAVKCFYWNISPFFSLHTWRLKRKIYICLSHAPYAGLPEHGNLRKQQSSSTNLGFLDGCNWSPLLWHFCTREQLQVKQAPYVKRFFIQPHHTQLHLWVIDSLFTEHFYHHLLKSQKTHPLHGVYCRSLSGPWPSVAPWQTGEALYPRGQSMIVLMWFLWYFVFQQKPRPHINRLPCAD